MRILYVFLFFILIAKAVASDTTKTAVEEKTLLVAGGCFWCVESDYENHPGVLKAESGYINGHVHNPTYQQVAGKQTGHFEAVKITYDASQVSPETLTEYFWKTIDPTDANGQFCDKGSPYKTALFYQNTQQKNIFLASLKALQKTKPFNGAIATEVLAAKTFYLAEEYHQDYYKKNPLRYQFYRQSCRRDATIKKLWGEVASSKYH